MAEVVRDYPKRPRFFANRFIRVLAKACVANYLGPEGFTLLAVIAMTEDAKGYRDPVTFFNEQLMPLVGAKNVKALDRVRSKAVVAGWLIYQPGGKGKAGRYWVDIPTAHTGWDDAPTDEPTACGLAEVDDYSVAKSTKEVGKEPGENRERTGREVGKEPGDNRQTSGQHSSLSLPLTLPLIQDPPTPAAAGATVEASKKRKKPPKALAETVPIPPQLDTPDFRGVWSEWLAARRDKSNPVTARAAAMQFKTLLPLGVERAISSVEASIANDWTGIFPERKSSAGLRLHQPGAKRTVADVLAAAQAKRQQQPQLPLEGTGT
jgi:hypothetical protein